MYNVHMEYTDIELALDAFSVPSRSLIDDINETIDRVIQRQITQISIELHDKLQNAYRRREYIARKIHKEDQYLHIIDCREQADIYISGYEEDLRKERDVAINALYGLAKYRKEMALQWITENMI